MLTLILIGCIVTCIILVRIAIILKTKFNNEEAAYAMGCLSAIVIIITVFISIWWFNNLADVCTAHTIDQKIEMYQEENHALEENIDIIVQKSLDYEKSTLKNIKPENYTALFYKYPELKSIPLLKEQIDLHETNTDQIKQLKEQKIDLAKQRFWIYFGK